MEQIIKNDLAWEHKYHNYCGMNFQPGLTLKCSECYKVNKEREAKVEARREYSIQENDFRAIVKDESRINRNNPYINA